MSVISERTAIGRRKPGVHGLACRGGESRRRLPVAEPVTAVRITVRGGRRGHGIQGASDDVARNARNLINSLERRSERTSVTPIQVDFSTQSTTALYGYSQTVCNLCPFERLLYGIMAGSAVLAASAGLYWIGQLVSHWAVFGAGIDKLFQ